MKDKRRQPSSEYTVNDPANDPILYFKNFIDSETKRYNRIKLMRRILLIIFPVYIAFVVVFMLHSESRQLVDKENLKNKLSSVIDNGAQLYLIKHIYDVREVEPVSLFKVYNKSLYYSYDTPLSSILNDLCVDYYSSTQFKEDSTYYARLSRIIEENQIHNPFDILEEVQIRYFESLRTKIGDNYDAVQDDVEQIATELSQKNQLVTKYLNKSNTSFIISIIAIILSIVLSIIQIGQNNSMTEKINAFINNRIINNPINKESKEHEKN